MKFYFTYAITKVTVPVLVIIKLFYHSLILDCTLIWFTIKSLELRSGGSILKYFICSIL